MLVIKKGFLYQNKQDKTHCVLESVQYSKVSAKTSLKDKPLIVDLDVFKENYENVFYSKVQSIAFENRDLFEIKQSYGKNQERLFSFKRRPLGFNPC